MSKFIKAAAAVAVLATAQMAVAPAAEAGPRHRFVGGLIAGLTVGALATGAVVASPRYVYASDCSALRHRALYNESIGRHGRAAYFWDRYALCRG